MNKFLLCVCDDQRRNINIITANIKLLQAKYDFLDDVKELKFKDILEDDILQIVKPDLLILDLYDKKSNEWAGKACLELIKASNQTIPTILFYGDKDGVEVYDDFTKEFPFVIREIHKKKEKAVGLTEVIEGELMKRLPAQFSLKFENDLVLQNQILAIGENNLNQICKSIRDKYNIREIIKLERMVPGYSGAVLFKFRLENTHYILKASNETSKLMLELDNAKNYYHKFPFFNYISNHVVKTSEEKVIAIIIKLIENGKTLFDFIKEKDGVDIIEVLNEIFLEEYSLKKHYQDQRQSKQLWITIFEKFTDSRFALIREVITELAPIIHGHNFNESDLQNFLLNQSYKNLDKTRLTKDSVSVLCHGDLHSKNILIQNRRPTLIDTGGIKYDYWCMDISRLIVDLFSKGIAYRSLDYYDVHKVKENVELAKLIFMQKKLPLDGKNDKFIIAINWLVENCSEVYGDLYSLFEFQLGLIKEFLQVSTRIDTMPPNKRTIALLAAYEGMLFANESAQLGS